MKLAYGNYGMPRTPWPEMLRLVAEIGYDGVEVCVGPIYPTAPEHMAADDRARFREECGALGLGIASLLAVGASLLEPDPAQHAANLRRLTEVVALGLDLGMATPVVVNTLGGKSADWETGRDQMLERVRDWSRAARGAGGVFAIEPHVGGLIDSPERARWLLNALGGDAGVNFDYSHFELRPTRLDEAMDALLPRALGIHVKDVSGPYPSVRFLLPGEGTLDYAAYFRELIARGYDGWVTVEISGQIFNAAGYDAERAARFSYDTLSRAARAAGVARPDRTPARPPSKERRMPVLIDPTTAQRFQMGGGDSRRLVGPEAGARAVSMNFSVFQPGHEFPQHVHDASADVFIVLDGGVSVRQGDSYTPIRAGDLAYIPPGEVHGTVNQTDGVATLISFQSPPDDALYRGERDSSRSAEAPKPPPGHVSKVKLANLTGDAPSTRPGVRAWTPVGAGGGTELRVSCYEVAPGAALDVATDGERIVFVSEGSTALENGSTAATLGRWTGAFIKAGEAVRLRNDGSTPARVIECCPIGS